MSRARNRRLPVLRVLALLGCLAIWAGACGGPQPLGGAGSVCFRTDECQAGLACVPETPAATKHVCSADLSGIVSMVDGGPADGDMPDAKGGASGAPQAGGPATAGALASAGTAGKSANAGGPGAAGAATAGAAAGGSANTGAGAAGTPAGGAPAGGAPAGGAPAGGAPVSSSSGAANAGAATGGTSAGAG